MSPVIWSQRRAAVRSCIAAVAVVGAVAGGVAGGFAWWGDRTGEAGPAAPRTAVALPTPVPPSGPAPEAPARRPWHVTGLGDSVTSGQGCDCDFVADYARIAADRTGRTVTSTNLGAGGSTSADLLDALADGTPTARAVAGSDVVVVTIGANDLLPDLAAWQDGACDLACFTPGIETVRGNVARVVGRVRALRAGAATEVLVTDYWNVFEDGDRAVRDHGTAYLDLARSVTSRTDAAICAGATSAGAACIDLLGPFRAADGGVDALLQDDGDHPDGDGHALIARTLAAHGWSELAAAG